MSMTEAEIDQSLNKMNLLISSELVSLCYDEKALQLRFEKSEHFYWLTFSLKPGYPYVFLSEDRIYLAKNLKKPLTIFLKTHFLGQNLREVLRLKEKGRVIELRFSQDSFIRVTLFPGGQNIEICHEGKTLYAYKPKEQKAHEKTEVREQELRDQSFFKERWQSQNIRKEGVKKDSPKVSDNKKDLKKKENGLRKMQEKLEQYKDSHWLGLGNWLKENQTLEMVPEEWVEYVDIEKSLSWNIENTFKLHKKNMSKIEGTLERISELETEIEKLKSGKVSHVKVIEKSLMTQSEAKGRTYDLGGAKVYIGKSAKDNLTLLRRAKPWYLWLHIRDYPGAYGIIECQKKQGEVSQAILQKAAGFVVKQSVGDKAEGKYEVLIAECRFVRPIKGAKSGQVTYSHEKVITVKV